MSVETGKEQPKKMAANSVVWPIVVAGVGATLLLWAGASLVDGSPVNTRNVSTLVVLGGVVLMMGLSSLAYVFAELIIENGPVSNATKPEEAKPEPSDAPAQGS